MKRDKGAQLNQTTLPSVTFAARASDPFTQDLQRRAQQYFVSHGNNSNANGLMFIKSAFYLVGYFLFIGWVLSGSIHSNFVLLMCYAVLGFFSVGIGFNIAHDAIHGAYSSSRNVNRWMSQTFLLLGANVYNWKVLHNVIHHSYTNIAGADGDLHPVPLLRFYPSNEGLKWYHRFQHFYVTFLYALTSLVWVFKKDFDHINKKRHLIYEKPELPEGEMLRLIVGKVVYLGMFLVAPLFLYHWTLVLTGFVLMHLIQGLMLAMVFQLGHIVEGPAITHLQEEVNELPSWHRIQLDGTSNFAPGSFLANWICGGLNHQIEHHLFPQVCHVHYPALSKIVKETAAEHGLTYHEQPTFRAAISSHYKLIKQFGQGASSEQSV